MAEAILPGTYITVRDEGLISAGSIASGIIGIVGTAAKGEVNKVYALGSISEAQEIFGNSDEWQSGKKGELTLIRALELIYNNGGQQVYAVRTAKEGGCKSASYTLKSGETRLVLFTAKTPGGWGNLIKITITEGSDEQTKDTKIIEFSLEKLQEKYSLAAVNTENLKALVDEVNKRSQLVTSQLVTEAAGRKTADPNKSVLANITTPESFTEGNDGADVGSTEYGKSLALLENEIINIVVLAGQTATNGADVLAAHLKKTAEIHRERIGIIGSGIENDKEELNQIANHNLNSDRLIFTAPGVEVANRNKGIDRLSGAYMAAAVAGLIASLPVQASPTNKTLNLKGITSIFNSTQLTKLVQSRVLAVEKRDGFRVVKGITTNNEAWKQITTRRIVDYAIYGVRSACNPYIGRLNNERVRGAMKATLNGFLTRMVDDEALVGYTLDVSATRAQEIEGTVAVTMTLQPTFSIDFIKVTMYLS